MNPLEIYTSSYLADLTRSRTQETKIGEEIFSVESPDNWEEELKKSNCKFILLGIPEDIGVRANYGRGGAHTAWKPALESFLNQQSNLFFSGKELAVLGHITVSDLMERSASLDQKNKNDLMALRNLVSELDERVELVIRKIMALKKIPIIIGGGHNNAYPIIRGCSEALSQPINVINCDPHTDFRSMEGRHSGNGFSYAYHGHYMDRYSVCCMHEQYNTKDVLAEFSKENSHLYYNTYEHVFVRQNQSFSDALNQSIGFVMNKPCGVEIDLDAITNVPSSAKTSSGISPVQGRQYVYRCGAKLEALYLHIAEGAPILSHIKADNKTGKLIAYLITDFIKGTKEKTVNL